MSKVGKPNQSLSEAVLASEIKGNTLKVYWYLVRVPHSEVGVREVQRALNFSSPSVALHHLRKLGEYGLVEQKNTGEYVLVQEVKIGWLKLFARIGRFLLPKYLFYSIFLSTMLALYVFFYLPSIVTVSTLGMYGFTLMYVTSLTIIVIACGIMWVETIKIWRERPF